MVMDSYLGIGEYYVYLALLNLVISTLLIRPGVNLMNRIGKSKSFLVSLGFNLFSFLLLPLILTKSPYTLHYYVLFNITFAVSSAIANVAFYSILSDISDYCTLKSGVDRSATCFSLQSLASKTCLAVGIAFYIALAAWFGFDPASTEKNTEPDVYSGLVIAMCILPVLLTFITGFFFSRINIDGRRHAIIQRRLNGLNSKPAQPSGVAHKKNGY